MRTLLLFLILGSGTIYAQSPANSPLTPDEGRQILGQLQDLKASRQEIVVLKDGIDRDREQDAREAANYEKALELKDQELRIAQQRLDLANERADLNEQMYRSLAKGPGVGCRILRAITVGIARCQ